MVRAGLIGRRAVDPSHYELIWFCGPWRSRKGINMVSWTMALSYKDYYSFVDHDARVRRLIWFRGSLQLDLIWFCSGWRVRTRVNMVSRTMMILYKDIIWCDPKSNAPRTFPTPPYVCSSLPWCVSLCPGATLKGMPVCASLPWCDPRSYAPPTFPKPHTRVRICLGEFLSALVQS